VEPSYDLTPAISPLPAPPLPQRGPRPALVGLAAGLAAAVAFTLVFQQRQRQAVGPAPGDQGSLRIESTPAGAHLFVDGDPSGFTTPVVLRQLRAGRTVELRLVKAGYTTEARRIVVTPGESPAQTFTLREASGTVRLEGVPAGAALYVDDVRMDRLQPFTVSIGPHRIRIEESSDVIFSNSVEVRPGQQSLRIHAERRAR
jgi:hypothetical protein